jgi:hypothetical protein
MGLIHLPAFPATADREDLATVTDGPGPEAYVLIHNPPETPAGGYVLGWTLAVWPTGLRRPAWSLAARGASANAEVRVAQAVAVRVLAERGVAVLSWCDAEPADGLGGLVAFRAQLSPPTDPARRPAVAGPRSGPA